MKKIKTYWWLFLLLGTLFSCSSINNSSVSSSELINSGQVYGSGCGFIGEDPKYRLKLRSFVNDTLSDSLINWLNSTNIIKQVYAVEGLVKLSNTNALKLNNNEKEKIIELKRSRKIIWSCSGCSYYQERVKKALSNIELI